MQSCCFTRETTSHQKCPHERTVWHESRSNSFDRHVSARWVWSEVIRAVVQRLCISGDARLGGGLGRCSGKLMTPSAPLTHAIKATAGDAPLPVCWSVSAAPFSKTKGLHRRETQKRTRRNKQWRKTKSPTVVLKWQRGLVRLLV